MSDDIVYDLIRLVAAAMRRGNISGQEMIDELVDDDDPDTTWQRLTALRSAVQTAINRRLCGRRCQADEGYCAEQRGHAGGHRCNSPDH